MISLTREQKELLFGYFFGCLEEAEVSEARNLIESNTEASELYRKFRKSFCVLEGLNTGPCPDYLAERTIAKLKAAAYSTQTGQERLYSLLEEERNAGGGRSNFWRNFGEVAAVAAMILIVAGVSIPSLRSVRQASWQTKCQAQLLGISRGLDNYASDNGERLPAVALQAGSPWWKVGDQGVENQSNTRHLWLLVKGNYVLASDFVCPGRTEGRALQFDRSQVKNLMDFPARRYVTYSMQIMCDKSSAQMCNSNRILMADMNPVFEKMMEVFARNDGNQAKIVLSQELLRRNSVNHSSRGQNVMLGNGVVQFAVDRGVGIGGDDIYTLKDRDSYRGSEFPGSPDDTFLVP